MGYSHGRRWTHKDICNEVYRVMESLGIDRMPSANECRLVTGSWALSNAITRRGGFEWLSKHMGLSRKECQSKLGLHGELKIKSILEEMGYKVEKMKGSHPYDLLINENVKVDVKTSKLYKSGKGWNSYSFNLEKANPTCDIYVFVCIEDEKYLIIPSKFLKQTQLCITDKESKYEIYRDRWDYIDKFDNFYKSVI